MTAQTSSSQSKGPLAWLDDVPEVVTPKTPQNADEALDALLKHDEFDALIQEVAEKIWNDYIDFAKQRCEGAGIKRTHKKYEVSPKLATFSSAPALKALYDETGNYSRNIYSYRNSKKEDRVPQKYRIQENRPKKEVHFRFFHAVAERVFQELERKIEDIDIKHRKLIDLRAETPHCCGPQHAWYQIARILQCLCCPLSCPVTCLATCCQDSDEEQNIQNAPWMMSEETESCLNRDFNQTKGLYQYSTVTMKSKIVSQEKSPLLEGAEDVDDEEKI